MVKRMAQGGRAFRPWLVGRLRDARVQPGSMLSYKRVLGRYCEWVLKEAGFRPRRETEIDIWGERYCEYVYREGLPGYLALQLTAALAWDSPDLGRKGALPLTHAAARGFRSLIEEERNSWPPLAPELAFSVAVVLTQWEELDAAAAVLCGFHCYLRTEEVAKMSVGSVMLPGDLRLGRGAKPSVTVVKAKGGPLQTVELNDLVVIRALSTTVERRRAGGGGQETRLFGGLSGKELRGWVRASLKFLGIADPPYKWHSLRHGSAAHDWGSRALTFELVKVRGRWKSDKSCRLYIAKARADFMGGGLPWGDRELVRLLVGGRHCELLGLSGGGEERFARL
jgi:hypothetical protein